MQTITTKNGLKGLKRIDTIGSQNKLELYLTLTGFQSAFSLRSKQNSSNQIISNKQDYGYK